MLSVISIGSLGLAGCPDRAEERPPAQTVPMGQPDAVVRDAGAAGATITQPSAQPAAEAPRAPDAGLALDAGTAPSAPGPTPASVDPAETSGNLYDFSGFSRDESLFAFTVFSEAAGLHLLHVVSGDAGKLEQRFQLVDDAATEKARSYLREHGFTREQGTLPPEVKAGLSLTALRGKARVILKEGAEERVLYEGDPFQTPGAAGGVKRVALAQVAPSGKRIAVKVEQTPVTEWGGIVGYILVDVGASK